MEIGGEGEEVVSMPISTSYATPNDSSRLRMLASSAACPDDADDTTNNGHGHGHGHPGHGHGHSHSHSHSHAHNNNSAGSIIRRRGEKQQARAVRYRECLKNHAATLGGHVTDGCGEFMPAGDHGTADSLRCAACDCHRNFHRREVEGEEENCEACYQRRATGLVGHPPTGLLPAPLPSPALPFAARAPPQVLAFRTTDDHSEGFHSPAGGLSSGSVKKRFRTKFTADQKERMLSFAQRLGWRIQKHDESSVQNFCQEVGVKRHVLKVWMHNNKHAYTRGGGGGTPGSGGGASSALAHSGDHLININSNNHMHDNAVTTTTATNSSSNNDSTHSERDFQ